MSKVITSPVKRFAGTVTLPDSLSYPQYIQLVKAWRAVQTMGKDAIDAERRAELLAEQRAELLPAYLAIVEKWELSNFPPVPTIDTFPATPPNASSKLLAWLTGELGAMLNEEDESPNE